MNTVFLPFTSRLSRLLMPWWFSGVVQSCVWVLQSTVLFRQLMRFAACLLWSVAQNLLIYITVADTCVCVTLAHGSLTMIMSLVKGNLLPNRFSYRVLPTHNNNKIINIFIKTKNNIKASRTFTDGNCKGLTHNRYIHLRLLCTSTAVLLCCCRLVHSICYSIREQQAGQKQGSH